MIGKKMLNAIVAASVIAGVAGAQEGQRPTRTPERAQKPAPPQGERIRARREAVAAPTTDTGTTTAGNGTDQLRRPDENARPEAGDPADHEAMVFTFLAAHPELVERLIARADTDGDGKLSPDERTAMREHLRRRAHELRELAHERRDQRHDEMKEWREEHAEERQERRDERRDDLRDRREERVDDRQDRRDDRQQTQQERVEQRGRPAPPRVGTGTGTRQRQ